MVARKEHMSYEDLARAVVLQAIVDATDPHDVAHYTTTIHKQKSVKYLDEARRWLRSQTDGWWFELAQYDQVTLLRGLHERGILL